MIGRSLAAAALLAALGAPSSATAGGFGINKVRYREFPWRILNTEHFEIYYYPEEEALAYEICQTAEKAWQREIEYFRLIRAPQRKVPVFCYATFHDFIQTNVTPEPLEEGVGGFTEVFKTRVVLPLGPSAEQRRTVITHELVHAHQFFILFGEGLRSYSLYKSILVPIWFTEGMAEHVADDWDPQGRMVLRDAVLTGRLPSLSLLHSFNHLEPHDAYLGYKAGQSACDFLGKEFGEEKIPAILKGIEDAKTFSQVFADKVGIPFAEFDRRWHRRLKEEAWGWSAGRKDADEYGKALVAGTPGRTELNGSPAPSPTDDTIAYLSDRPGYRGLFLLRKGGSPSAVFGNASVELAGSAPAWSPDGKTLALILKQGPGNVIGLVNVRRRKLVRRLAFPFLDLGQPRFSPDGASIVFSGFNGVAAELYRVDLATGSWCQLTRDRTAAGFPAFTPDGSRIVYSSETPDGVVLKVLEDLGAAEPRSRPLVARTPLKGSRPDVSPDGKWVLFDSGENGAPNLYLAAIDGTEVRQVTDARTGIWAGRWARDGKRIVAVTLEAGCQNIYLLSEAAARQARPPEAAGGTASRSTLGAPASAVPGKPPTGRGARGGGVIEVPRSQLAPPAKEFKVGDSVASSPERQPRLGPVGAPPAAAAAGWILPMPAIGPARTRPWAVPALGGPAAAFPRDPMTLLRPVIVHAIASAAPASTARDKSAAAPPARKAEPTRPIAPLALTARREGAEVVLTWTSPVPRSELSRYEVYRSTRTGAPLLLAVLFDPSGTAWRDATWQYDETYSYRVEGRDAADRISAAGTVPFTTHVDVWPSEYKLTLDSRLVDLFVLVGSITIGGGTSFAGYGALQLSDLPGNNRLSLEADAFPSFSNAYGLSYEYSGRRPDVAVGVYSEQTRFILYPSIVSTEHRDSPPSLVGADGAAADLTWPFDKYHRIEASGGVQQVSEIFTDRYGDVVFGPKKSLMFPVRLGLVRDTSRWRRLLPTGGVQARLDLTQTVPVGGRALRFTEYGGQLQWYLGLFDDVSIASRWMGMLSEGHDKRYVYFGGHYFLRGLPYASQSGNAALLGNHELRLNLLSHLNIPLPLLPLLLTDIQGVGFTDVGGGFDAARGLRADEFRAASVGGGLNFIAFMLQSQPIMFSVEVARRIDRHQTRPTVYGRLGPVF